MKKFFLLFVCLMFVPILSYAQTRVVTGTVISAEDGQPYPFVTVLVKGTTIITTTGNDGKYSITVPANGTTLVFTFFGMKEQEVVIGSRSIIDVAMEYATTQLDEVTVVGYGVVALGGAPLSARSTVTKDRLGVPLTSFDKALQGNAPGVLSLSNSGQPGSGQQVVIRGIGTINASTEPLYVLDGVPIITGGYGNTQPTQGSLTGYAYSTMASINPNDIESITILKDAAATSIYGARATNGVILITTKRGQAGKTRFNVKVDRGFSSATTKSFTVMRKDDYLAYITEARINAGYSDATILVGGKPVLRDIAESFRYRTADNDFYDFDWQGHAYSNSAPTTNVDFTMSGGTDKTRFFLSFSHKDQVGTVIDSDFKLYAGRFNFDHQINSKLKLSLGLNLSYKVQSSPQEGSVFAAPVYASGHISPLDPGISRGHSDLYAGFPHF